MPGRALLWSAGAWLLSFWHMCFAHCRSAGVEEVAETGVQFDPQVHEAIMMVRERTAA